MARTLSAEVGSRPAWRVRRTRGLEPCPDRGCGSSMGGAAVRRLAVAAVDDPHLAQAGPLGLRRHRHGRDATGSTRRVAATGWSSEVASARAAGAHHDGASRPATRWRARRRRRCSCGEGVAGASIEHDEWSVVLRSAALWCRDPCCSDNLAVGLAVPGIAQKPPRLRVPPHLGRGPSEDLAVLHEAGFLGDSVVELHRASVLVSCVSQWTREQPAAFAASQTCSISRRPIPRPRAPSATNRSWR